MSATVCPFCHALLTTRERALAACPKCAKSLPPLQDVKTISDRRIVRHNDRLNDKRFCYRMSLACVASAFLALMVSCLILQTGGEGESVGTLTSVLFTSIALIFLVACVIFGYFGLSSGIRNQWVESIVLSALGLVLGGMQLAFWLASFVSLFLQSGDAI